MTVLAFIISKRAPFVICMKFMSFPGERRGLTGEGGGRARGADRFPSLVGVGRGGKGGAAQLT